MKIRPPTEEEVKTGIRNIDEEEKETMQKLLKKGVALCRERKYYDSSDYFTGAIDVCPHHPMPWLYVAFLLYKDRDYFGSVEGLKAFVEEVQKFSRVLPQEVPPQHVLLAKEISGIIKPLIPKLKDPHFNKTAWKKIRKIDWDKIVKEDPDAYAAFYNKVSIH